MTSNHSDKLLLQKLEMSGNLSLDPYLGMVFSSQSQMVNEERLSLRWAGPKVFWVCLKHIRVMLETRHLVQQLSTKRAFEKMCQLASSQVPRILLTWNYFCKNWISIDYFQRDITLCRSKMSQLCFRILRVGRKGFYMAGIYFSWKPNAEPLWSAKYSKNNVFKFWRTIFNYDVINQNAYVPSFLVR